jgi:hypothetical protein
MGVVIGDSLALERCPDCGVAKPLLKHVHKQAIGGGGADRTGWHMYLCTTCMGCVCALGSLGYVAQAIIPAIDNVAESIPEKPRSLLSQAKSSLVAPAGSVMLSASAIDSMLKERGLVDGSLYKRIDGAVASHLITQDMADWAHYVRLDANDQRHADVAATLPTIDDAKKCLDFALALAEVLFVLPARVREGMGNANSAG